MDGTNSTDYGPRDLVGYGPHRPDAKWPGGAKIAISLVLNYEEGSEVCLENGDSQSESIASELGPGVKPMENERNVNIESLYEYGSRAGVWRILRLFKEYGVKCTSYAVGQALLKNPQVAEVLERDGHEIASHGWRWVDRSKWSAEEEVSHAHDAITAIQRTSPFMKAPVGWYYGMVNSQASVRSRALVAQVYRERNLDLKYYSDDYSDDLPHWIPMPGGEEGEGLLIVPYALDTNDYKNAGYQAFISPADFASYLIGSFDELYREGQAGKPAMMSVGLHARIVGRPARIAGLRMFLEYAKSKEGVWFATREEIADHWRREFPYQPTY